jgi:ADP-sugar diphosphatase
MFGDKVGFVNLKTTTLKDGFNLPSYVFLRGPAVAMLMFVNDKILVVEQYRVPIQ